MFVCFGLDAVDRGSGGGNGLCNVGFRLLLGFFIGLGLLQQLLASEPFRDLDSNTIR